MGRVIQGSTLVKTPQIKFTRENVDDIPGTYFIGQLTGRRKIKDTSIVFEFLLEDAHPQLAILIGIGEKLWKEADVNAGDKVSLFGSYNEKTGMPNQLADKLSQAADGDRVKVMFNGKAQNPKSKRFYNDFTVEVL